MTAPSVAPITNAIFAALETTGRPISRNGAPAGTAVPYAFVTRTNLLWMGSLRNGAEMAEITYQVTCVGVSDDQVEWMTAHARNVLSEALTVPGWHFIEWLVPEGDPGIRPDNDDPNEQLLFSASQWQLIAQPSPDPLDDFETAGYIPADFS